MKKIKLCFLFFIGAISCIGSAMRQVIQTNIKPDFTCKPHLEYVSLTQMSISLINAVDDSIRSFQWITVAIFFAITAASLPILNATIPKSWRGESNNGTPQLNYIANSFNKSHHEGPERTKSESSLKNAGQIGPVFHSEEILHEDEKIRQPSVVQLPRFN